MHLRAALLGITVTYQTGLPGKSPEDSVGKGSGVRGQAETMGIDGFV
jgi:hypothetical protein